MAVKAVLFDMDGTVTDSEPINFLAWCHVFKRHGYEDCEEYLNQCTGLNHASMQVLLNDTFGKDYIIKDLVPESLEFVYDYYDKHGVPLKKGFYELNKYLDKNEIKKFIATSSAHNMAEKILGKAGILDCFDGIVGGDEVEKGKPAPDPFLKAAEKAGESVENCIVIEDSTNGLKSALAAGIKAVFIKDTVEISDELKKQIYCEASSLDKVIDVIEKLK